MKNKLFQLMQYVKFNLYTVDNLFVLQLFDKSANPNDIDAVCLWENDHFNLESLLDEAIKWCEEKYGPCLCALIDNIGEYKTICDALGIKTCLDNKEESI